MKKKKYVLFYSDNPSKSKKSIFVCKESIKENESIFNIVLNIVRSIVSNIGFCRYLF